MDILSVLVLILVVTLVGYLVWWLVGLTGMPEPIRIVLVLLAVLLVAYGVGSPANLHFR